MTSPGVSQPPDRNQDIKNFKNGHTRTRIETDGSEDHRAIHYTIYPVTALLGIEPRSSGSEPPMIAVTP